MFIDRKSRKNVTFGRRKHREVGFEITIEWKSILRELALYIILMGVYVRLFDYAFRRKSKY